MQKIFTCRYGSKLYGTDNQYSDDDFKTVYLPDHKDLILGKKLGITDESIKNSEGIKNSVGDIDSQLIPIQRFAYDFFNGVTYAVEIVWAYYSEGAEKNFEVFDYIVTYDLMEILKSYKNNNTQGMVGYAWGQAQKYQIKGSRVKTLIQLRDELVIFVEKYPKGNLKDFIDNLDIEAYDNRYVYTNFVEVNDGKLGCLTVLEKHHLETTSVYNVLKAIEKQLGKYGHRSLESVTNTQTVDWKSIHHAVRLMMQTIRYMTEGTIEIPYKGDVKDLLVNIKEGRVEYNYVVELMTNMLDYLDENKDKSILPEVTEKMLDNFEKDLYNLIHSCY